MAEDREDVLELAVENIEAIETNKNKVTPYSKASLEKALKKWEDRYSKIYDDHTIVVEILEKQEKAEAVANKVTE